jgi:thiosulfate/3-mercaptopyruvate sulfurtransferase
MWTTLLSARELASALGESRIALIDCRFDLTDPAAGRRQYDEGHLPDAHYAHLDDDLSSPITRQTGRHPLPNASLLAEKFGLWGIDNNTQVVAYDASGGGFAARLWWLARWLGHEAVAVLDGGWQAWNAAGLPVTTDVTPKESRNFIAHVDDSKWLETAELVSRLDGVVLIDAREAERFRGEVEPIDPVAGHVPGAVNLPWKGNLAGDGKFLPASELQKRFSNGQVGDRPIACMCGSGVTACHNLLAMELAGIHGARLYAGSWSEWIRDAGRPVESVARFSES